MVIRISFSDLDIVKCLYIKYTHIYIYISTYISIYLNNLFNKLNDTKQLFRCIKQIRSIKLWYI